jgi:hypothetical protein
LLPSSVSILYVFFKQVELCNQDFGYPQTTSTEVLKSYIFNEPIMVDAGRLPPLGPAAMFMVRLVHITAGNITLGFF